MRAIHLINGTGILRARSASGHGGRIRPDRPSLGGIAALMLVAGLLVGRKSGRPSVPPPVPSKTELEPKQPEKAVHERPAKPERFAPTPTTEHGKQKASHKEPQKAPESGLEKTPSNLQRRSRRANRR